MVIEETCTGVEIIETININTIGGGGWVEVYSTTSIPALEDTGKYAYEYLYQYYLGGYNLYKIPG